MIKIHYTIKDFPLEERPREKVKQYGINNVTNKELLSIILKTGTKNINVEDLALSILRKYKLHELKDVTITELTKIKGIGEVKAIELLAAIELGKRINYKTEEKRKIGYSYIWNNFLCYTDCACCKLCYNNTFL